MPIKVKCKCGQAFSAKEEMAGKVVKCPNCAQALRIPQPAASQGDDPSAVGGISDLLDEVGLKAQHEDYVGRRCPSCDAPLAHNAVLCIECGYQLETGTFVEGIRNLGSAKAEDAAAEGLEGVAEVLLERARKTLKEDAREEKKQRTQGMPLWMIATLLIVSITFMCVMMFLPRGQAILITGWLWVVLLGIVQAVCGIRLIIIAFQESLSCGFMYLLVPFYSLYYIFTRYKLCGRLFWISFACGMLQQIGWALISWSATFKDEPQQESRRRVLDSPVVMASAPLVPSSAD